ncbi:MAG: PA2779 family protein [Gammaproteobacteria bacterium]|nr:PA2779 family protein [Gammaproteobacteria bacterium]
MRKSNNPLMALLVAAMLLSTFPAHAGFVGTEQMVAEQTRATSLSRIENALAGAEVAAQLEAWGVDPEQVAMRVGALSDIELAQLADTMETDPAGGVLIVLGIVFLVLIVLQLTGVLNAFR